MRVPDELDELVFDVKAGGDDVVEVLGPDDEHAFVALYSRRDVSTGDSWGYGMGRTDDEGAALLLVGARQPAHGVEHLDARVRVDEDRVGVLSPARLASVLILTQCKGGPSSKGQSMGA